MTIHPFGVTSSPSCVNLALRQAIADNAERFPKHLINLASECSYVEDCLFSVDTEEEAIGLIDNLKTITYSDGFRLVKWISNEECVLKPLPPEELRSPKSQHIIQYGCLESALDVVWNITKDRIQFDLKEFEGSPTRRKILSFAASIYDPLGILAPVLLNPKLLLQKLVRQKLEWDGQLSEEENNSWNRWLQEQKELSRASIPRCLTPKGLRRVALQLYCFSGSSEAAYGRPCTCDVWVRMKVICLLVLGKTRVTPIRTVSIPRLELTAAALLTRLATQLVEKMHLERPVIFWTDSMIVLQLLRCLTRSSPSIHDPPVFTS
ncbi:unnamed protein product [Echinostoma caproni]|uniref:Reverse transcriptase domain-containing protein n=1 Tax=Echinostoma caproni TaxID=27848 RepID=A0A183A9S3_9TREM|nr:unnamed protein product [Echinostoma caproni]